MSTRTVPIVRNKIPHADRSPDSAEQDRMSPAPLISGREGLVESSKDEYGSSPSHRQQYGLLDTT